MHFPNGQRSVGEEHDRLLAHRNVEVRVRNRMREGHAVDGHHVALVGFGTDTLQLESIFDRRH